jgi:prepilin-type N-terminal cleavage/methylation domain-containing protein
MGRTRPSRLIERRPAHGYTLVEVVVATLIAAIMVTAVFSTALTSKAGSGKSDHRLIASQGVRRLTSQLRLFQTGCGCDYNTGSCPAACGSGTLLGPTNRAGVASWYLNDHGNNIYDSAGDVWALKCSPTIHTVTGGNFLPKWFEDPPYNASLQYTVSNCSAGAAPKVDVTAHWDEP